MTHALQDDESLGLKLKGYILVPNDALETKIAVYTPEVVQSILVEHPEVAGRWLSKLHSEYISKKKSCDFENDPVACFTLSVYEEFEKHFKSWQDGGMIAISLPGNRSISISSRPLISIVSDNAANCLICSRCMAVFTDAAEFEKHRKGEEGAKKVEIKVKEGYDRSPPNPIWW